MPPRKAVLKTSKLVLYDEDSAMEDSEDRSDLTPPTRRTRSKVSKRKRKNETVKKEKA